TVVVIVRGGTLLMIPLSLTLSPLVPRGERESESALRCWRTAIPILLRPLSTKWVGKVKLCPMAFNPESRLDQLWKEYSLVFHDFDDLTLARWLAQTLGQLEGRVWRLSHPLMGAYRLAAQLAHDRQIWLKRLATAPGAYQESPCCRAPLMPLLTRDVLDSGLICQ